MYLWLFNYMLRLLAQGSGLGGCCAIALLWQAATKALECPFPTGLLVCNLQHGICLECFPSASECKLKAFFSLYFHRLLYIQVTETCRYRLNNINRCMLEYTEQLKQGLHLKVSLFSQGSRKLCSPDVPSETTSRNTVKNKKPQREETTHSKLLF